jgi:Flp pilus assembly protein TadG
MSRAVRRGRRERERGVTAVVVAIVLTVIAGFAALVINVGHMMAIRGQLQGATDSAALAAAVELDGSAEGLTAARAAAVDYAARHATDRGMAVVVRSGEDVIFGEWHFAARTFEPLAGATPAELARINAVRVLAGREEARGSAMDVTFGGGPVLEQKTADVRAESIAVLGGPSEGECGIPIAFADCLIQPGGEGTPLKCDEPLTFHSDGADGIGWTNLTQDPSVNTDLIRNMLLAAANLGDPAYAEWCHKVSLGDPIAVSNGAQVNAVIEQLRALIGTRLYAPIVKLPAGDESCGDKFNAHAAGAPVGGFASFTILQVNGGQQKSIVFKLDCEKVDAPPKTEGGGPNYGTVATSAVLVR